MNMNINLRLALRVIQSAVCFASLFVFSSHPVLATQGTDYIAPPKFNTTDKFSVNVLGGQVSANLDTVSIGGDMGLTHSIMARTNLFTWSGNYGYTDKYAGGLKWIKLGDHLAFYNGGPTQSIFVLKASVLGDSADFIVMRNGSYQSSGGSYTSDYYYEALGDKRHTLEPKNGSLVWTKPDGTEVYFQAGASAGSNRSVEKVIYPNGFTLVMYYNSGVTTNTGFQLKYDYINDDPGLEASKANVVFPSGSNVPSVAVSNSANWRLKNPKYVRGINNSVEYCNPAVIQPCALVRDWPKATFQWPGGMPRAIYINQSIFSVEDATGGTTRFHYESQDAALTDLTNPNSVIQNSGYAARMFMAPRLMAVTPAAATLPKVQYLYKNDIKNQGDVSVLASEAGVIVSASGLQGSTGYEATPADQYSARMYYSGAALNLITNVSNVPNTLEKITEYYGDRIVNFETNFRNLVISETSQNGPSKTYSYDARNNLNRVTLNGVENITAVYPASCTNRKTCNQPTSVTDARGNTTDYTYHDLSGQVATVTLPADKNGRRAQTRYEYTQQYANIKNASGVKVPAATPVWLKTAEKSCTTNSACAGAADEVITRFEYNSDNLLLTGMTVAADNKTLRTCYRYDIYGRQIGKTQPKADLASCN
jgi:YD repeat-containing protein